jgi:hypothetical protein
MTTATRNEELTGNRETQPRFSGNSDALYERHLLFDNAIDPQAADLRERFEALARSVRDLLSQRWVTRCRATPDEAGRVRRVPAE